MQREELFLLRYLNLSAIISSNTIKTPVSVKQNKLYLLLSGV